MELGEFYDKIESSGNFEGISIDSAEAKKPGVVIRDKASGLTTRLPVAAIEKAEWGVIEEVLSGKREPVVLQHMTRVVGYYSRIENWNKSKIGELKDRHKGDYSVACA